MAAKQAKPAAAAAPPAVPGSDPSLLRAQLSVRTDEVLATKAELGPLRRRIAALEGALADREASARDVMEEAARRAKEREAALQAQVHALEQDAARMRGQVALATEHVLETQRDAELRLRDKDLENAALRSRMDDIAAEFSEMLHALLQKLQERSLLSPGSGEDAEGAEGPGAILRAMKEAVPM